MTVETPFGKITASKAMLNTLSCQLDEASKSYYARDRKALSNEADLMSRAIFDALDAVGYYDSVKR